MTRYLKSAAAAGAALITSIGLAACGVSTAASGGKTGSVTVYSADGLHDGTPNWYTTVFKEFTKATGITVNYVEDGSGVVVTKVEAEKARPQADVLVTLPPFIQKAAADGDLQSYSPAGISQVSAADKASDGTWEAMVNNYPVWIYNSKQVPAAPRTWQDLLAPRYKGKLQYSTPGQAGDGTAFLIEVLHAFGGNTTAAFNYIKKLQANNVGPSASTGKLAGQVNSGNLDLANGDVQMNLQQQQTEDPNLKLFFPAGADGTPSAFALPYAMGLVKNAPDTANGKKLIDFLLSKQAQALISSQAVGYPVRTDVHPADGNFAKLEAALKGVRLYQPDWQQLLPQLNSLVARWHTVTGS